MHGKLFLRDQLQWDAGKTMKVAGETVKGPYGQQYLEFSRLLRELPPEVAEAESRGKFAKCAIEANGSTNLPREGVYDYTTPDLDPLYRGYYATVDINADGSWYLVLEAPNFGQARQAFIGIRNGSILPTTAYIDSGGSSDPAPAPDVEIWEFERAPKDLKYSIGGDEDYVVLSPSGNGLLAEQVARQLAVTRCTYVEVDWHGTTHPAFITRHA